MGANNESGYPAKGMVTNTCKRVLLLLSKRARPSRQQEKCGGNEGRVSMDAGTVVRVLGGGQSARKTKRPSRASQTNEAAQLSSSLLCTIAD